MFRKTVIDSIKKDIAVGSEDSNDIMFVGQRRKDATASTPGHIFASQDLAAEAAKEITFVLVTFVLGHINWLQGRTQARICYRFGRCASNAIIGDIWKLNKLVRVLKATEGRLRFWPPLHGKLRILG